MSDTGTRQAWGTGGPEGPPDAAGPEPDLRLVPGWRFFAYDSLPSTADMVRDLAEAGAPARLAVLAGQQTSGRGQLGRPWKSPPGNLCLSLMLRLREPMRELPQWALLIAVAVAEALEAFLPPASPLRLKWPNDVLVGSAKLAGILTEAAADAEGQIAWLGFGIGANLAVAPDLPDRATTSILREAGEAPPIMAVAPAIMASLDRWYAIRLAEGFAPIRAAWLARGPVPGAPLVIRQPAGEVQGAFAGLAEDGRLLLETPEGLRAFITGEIAA